MQVNPIDIHGFKQSVSWHIYPLKASNIPFFMRSKKALETRMSGKQPCVRLSFTVMFLAPRIDCGSAVPKRV